MAEEEKVTQAAEEAQAQQAEEKEKPAKKDKKKNKSAQLEEMQAKIDELNDRYLRLLAEYDNFRKRSKTEKENVHTTARADVIKNILPVLDNFERAANNTDASYEDYKKGMEMIFSQFLELLAKTGVETFGEPGEEFDPNMHNAVMHIEDENLGENVIAQVFQKGYKLGNTVIRFATVQVAN